ncbi:MAG TPA: hypothetical protein VGY57_09855 [Vicinamibacterales bacterium]|nr:hypothetical protein [Vicinamibacterales bacterium]
MNAHVDFVGVLFIVWGLLTTLIGVSTLALGVGAVAVIATTNRSGGADMAAGLTAGFFFALALIAILWGAAHVVIGVTLRRRHAWARLAALVLGTVDLVLLPFGTALGIYALWTLLNERGKSAFTDSLSSS